MPDRINMVGNKYGRLFVVSDRDESGVLLGTPSARRVLVRCDCGNEKIVNARSVRRGHTNSCGCMQRESASSHGLDKHPLAGVWRTMRARCYSQSQDSYRYYGGRGIKVCDEWRGDLPAFVKWMEDNGWRPGKGLQIDRIDSDGDYCPENCRVVSATKNQNNKTSNHYIRVYGRKMTVADAAREFDIPYPVIHQRVYKLGWDGDKAVSVPVRKLKRRTAA